MGLLKPNGLMVLSHTGSSESTNLPGVVVVDNRGYGTAVPYILPPREVNENKLDAAASFYIIGLL